MKQNMSEINITSQILFNDKMWYFKMPDHEIWKDKLETIEKIETNKSTSKINTQPKVECNVKSMRTGWESHKIYPAIWEICNIITNTYLWKISESEKYELNEGFLCPTNSWLNIYKKNQHAIPHQHGGAVFSVVYFVKIPKDSCDFYFHNHRKSILNSTLDGQMSDLKVDVKEGHVIVFNGDLMHSVTSNMSEETRLTLAINYKVEYYVQ